MFILNTCFESQVIIIQRVSRYFFFRIDPKNRNGARVSAQLTDRKRFISFKDLQSVPLYSFVYYYLYGVVFKNIHSNRHQTFTCRILWWTAELNAKESDGIIILVWLQSFPTNKYFWMYCASGCVRALRMQGRDSKFFEFFYSHINPINVVTLPHDKSTN